MRQLIFFLFLSFGWGLQSQDVDTTQLPLFENWIRAIEKEAGTFEMNFDSLDHRLNLAGNLADLFFHSAAVNLRVNSPGNLSSLSFRGLSGVHTRVAWHGLNINAPGQGLTDLSSIRQSLFNNVSLRSDAYPSSVLNLDNKVEWNDKYLTVLFGLESFEGRNYALTYHVGNTDFYSRTHFDYAKAENSYPFRDNTVVGGVLQNRTNSQHRIWNLQQDVGLVNVGRSSKNTHSFHLWLTGYDRNIPGSLDKPSTMANQIDNSVRIAYKWQLDQSDLKWTTVLGYLRDRLKFSDLLSDMESGEQTPIETDYTQRRIHLDSKFKYTLEDYAFYGGIELRTMNVESNNYGVLTPESAIAFQGKVQRNWKRARLNWSFKQEFSSIFTFPFNSNLGYDQYFNNGRIWASIKRIGRAPNYDDLFFNPGGNPELRPENGWSYELGYEWQPRESSSLSAHVYRNEINDWIQWVPADTLFNFSPVNYSRVLVNGVRIDYSASHTKGGIDLITKASLSIQNSENRQTGMADFDKLQLPQSPNIILNTTLAIQERRSTFGYRSRYVSEQYADELNTQVIAHSFVHDLFFTTAFAYRFRLNIRVNNITNLTYFTTNSYPMFGRNFGFELIYRSKASEDKKEKTRAKTKRRRGRRW